MNVEFAQKAPRISPHVAIDRPTAGGRSKPISIEGKRPRDLKQSSIARLEIRFGFQRHLAARTALNRFSHYADPKNAYTLSLPSFRVQRAFPLRGEQTNSRFPPHSPLLPLRISVSFRRYLSPHLSPFAHPPVQRFRWLLILRS